MTTDDAAKYLEELACKVRSGEVFGVSTVEVDQNGVARAKVLFVPDSNDGRRVENSAR